MKRPTKHNMTGRTPAKPEIQYLRPTRVLTKETPMPKQMLNIDYAALEMRTLTTMGEHVQRKKYR